MDNKVHRIIIEEKSQEISENDLSITNKINNEILKTEDSISKYNSESKELDFKFNKIKLKLRGSLKIHSEKKIPIIRKTSYKENIKSMFSKEKKKSRNSNQITTTASSLEQIKSLKWFLFQKYQIIQLVIQNKKSIHVFLNYLLVEKKI